MSMTGCDLRWIRRICAYWLGNKVTQTVRVSCACETAGLANSIGLRKVGRREKAMRFGKEILYTLFYNPYQVLLPPLHIKLGLMKQFVTALNRESDFCIFVWKSLCTEHRKVECRNFGWPSDTTFNVGQIFSTCHDNPGKNAWRSFTAFVENFLRNLKALKYHNLIKTAVKFLRTIRVQYECEGSFSSESCQLFSW